MEAWVVNESVRYVVFRVFDASTARTMLARRDIKKSGKSDREIRHTLRPVLGKLQSVVRKMTLARTNGVLNAADEAYLRRTGPAAIDVILQAVAQTVCDGPKPLYRTCTGFHGISNQRWADCS